ncbi:MAG: formimidoylglutamate deiminase [Piscinibacter sp.]|nr:formimidoylglutamate deiminase [Piscinibacter sp.]
MSNLFADHALLPDGWARDVLLHWDGAGTLTAVQADADPGDAPRAPGVLLPGMPNLHSHAFQRVFAGLTECRGAQGDSFWTWRDRMYRVALAVSPEQLEDIATQLYIEMLAAGYTSVCEFHYLHHAPDGRPYADPAEMSRRLAAAAQRAGIGLTLLPVLYRHGGFGPTPARPDQRRFVSRVDALLHSVEALRAAGLRVGVAPHSLRAVAADDLRALLDGLAAIDGDAPVHIHIAEQRREVQDCLDWSGLRPVRWLFEHAAIDARWCLVHATHLDDGECDAIARSGAVVGLCPTTEANLGDGLFDAPRYRGAWGIGSDSHASVDVAEELRLLEYGQRLARGERNVLGDTPQVADGLWRAAVAGGAQAAARPVAGLAVGQRADFIVLGDALLDGLSPAQQLATLVFAPRRRELLREVWAGGLCRVRAGWHDGAAAAQQRFVAARRGLLGEL